MAWLTCALAHWAISISKVRFRALFAIKRPAHANKAPGREAWRHSWGEGGRSYWGSRADHGGKVGGAGARWGGGTVQEQISDVAGVSLCPSVVLGARGL